MLKYLFAPPGSYKACGMFTLPHIISLIICVFLIGGAVFLTRNISPETLKKITRAFAYVLTAMEIIKIIYKFAVKDTAQLDFWLPLSFCSLFIYTLWMAGYGKGIVKSIGLAFIVGGGFTGGLTFLIMPTTSLMANPIFHYLSIHSMFFHSCMIYICIMYMMKGDFRATLKNYKYFVSFVFSAIVICVILNVIFRCNLMVISLPVNIPIKAINKAAAKLPWLYTLCTALIYCIVPYAVSMALDKLILKLKRSK